MRVHFGKAEVLRGILFLSSLFLAGVPAVVSAQIASDEPEVLRPGDRVRVGVWRQPEFTGEFVVTEEGVVAHPLYRQVTVAWRPVSELHEAFRTFLLDYEADPRVVIEPFFNVAVVGQVLSPNMQQLRPGTTIPEAIATAGGFGPEADRSDVTLRRGAQDYSIDLQDADSPNVVLTVRSGDQIIVGRDTAFFREYVLPAVTFVGSLASLYRVFDLVSD
jgi:polysaccharide export outer membrane protein